MLISTGMHIRNRVPLLFTFAIANFFKKSNVHTFLPHKTMKVILLSNLKGRNSDILKLQENFLYNHITESGDLIYVNVMGTEK